MLVTTGLQARTPNSGRHVNSILALSCGRPMQIVMTVHEGVGPVLEKQNHR